MLWLKLSATFHEHPKMVRVRHEAGARADSAELGWYRLLMAAKRYERWEFASEQHLEHVAGSFYRFVLLYREAGLLDGLTVHDGESYNSAKSPADRKAEQRARDIERDTSHDAVVTGERDMSHGARDSRARERVERVDETERVDEATAPDPWDDPEHEVLVWLSKHGCDVRPGNGYHRKLVTAVEVHGANAIIGMMDRLAAAGTKHGDIKGYLFGAIDALDARGRPSLTDLSKADRAEESAAASRREVERTQRYLASLRETS